MPTAKVTAKGQITIPKDVRDALGVEAGDHVHFLIRGDGVVEMLPRTRDLLTLAGCLARGGRRATVEEMDRGIAAAVAAEHARSSE